MGDEPLGHHVIIVISCHITSLCWLWSVNFSTSPEVGSCWSEVQSSLVAKQWQPGPSCSRWFPPRKAPEIFMIWFRWFVGLILLSLSVIFLSSFCQFMPLSAPHQGYDSVAGGPHTPLQRGPGTPITTPRGLPCQPDLSSFSSDPRSILRFCCLSQWSSLCDSKWLQSDLFSMPWLPWGHTSPFAHGLCFQFVCHAEKKRTRRAQWRHGQRHGRLCSALPPPMSRQMK